MILETVILENDRQLDELLSNYRQKEGALIPVLQATQEIYGYLPKEAMRKIAIALKIPFSEVFGVATFYAQFQLKPRGKHIVRVCSGTACHVRGGKSVLETIEMELGIKSGETTEDLTFTIEPVACLGACGLAPVMVIDDQVYGKLTTQKIKEAIKNYN